MKMQSVEMLLLEFGNNFEFIEVAKSSTVHISTTLNRHASKIQIKSKLCRRNLSGSSVDWDNYG